MKTLLHGLLLLGLILPGCGESDGPDWAERERQREADPNTDEPRRTPTPIPTSPRDEWPEDPDDRDRPIPRERDSDPDNRPIPRENPQRGGNLEVIDVWGDGLEIEVDSLHWLDEGEMQFRVGVVEEGTRAPIRLVDARDFHFAEDSVNLGSEALFEIERAKDLKVVMVLDVSGSISDANALESLRNAARTLVDSLPREAQVAVVGFATGHEILVNFSDDPRDVYNAIERLQPPDGRAGQFTNLWGAVQTAATMLGKPNGDDGGRAVVVFTDGRDNVAESDFNTAVTSLTASAAATYVVGLGDDVDVDALQRLAGGARFTQTVDPRRLESVFEEIATRIGERITVRYVTPKQSGTHELDVMVTEGDESAGFTVQFTLE